MLTRKTYPEEYKHFIMVYGFNITRYEEIFQRLDANSDCYISKEEYMQFLA